jgi:hypothetical protein
MGRKGLQVDIDTTKRKERFDSEKQQQHIL